MTLSDLLKLYKSFKQDDVYMPEFVKRWEDAVGKDGPELELDNVESKYTIRGIPADDQQVFAIATEPLVLFYENYDPVWDDVFMLGDNLDLDFYIELIELYIEDKDKDITERRYPKDLKYEFICKHRDKGPFEDEDDKTVRALFRRFVDEYVNEGDSFGYEVKGYSCYGGNWAYDCDWESARDLISKLLEKDNNPFAANSLGYIYYYGRCNGGKPQYEEALKYFMIGTVHGLYESAYKLGDMYYNGYGTPKQPEGAWNLYSWVYENSKHSFTGGNFGFQFADAALRMGRYTLDHVPDGSPEDDYDIQDEITEAYAFLLQADYAIKLRMLNHDHYGDGVVNKAIQEQLAKAKALYDEQGGKPKRIIKHYTPIEFNNIITDHKKAELTVKDLDSGKHELMVSLTPDEAAWDGQQILLTVPEKDFCQLVNEVAYTVPSDAIINVRNKKKTVTFDSIYFNNDETVFCDGSRWVAKIMAGYYSLRVPKKQGPSSLPSIQ